MATSQLLASGSTPAESSTFVLADGEMATVFLKEGAVSPGVAIEIQNFTNTAYTQIYTLSMQNPAGVVSGPGTYRVRRFAGTCGVDRG